MVNIVAYYRIQFTATKQRQQLHYDFNIAQTFKFSAISLLGGVKEAH